MLHESSAQRIGALIIASESTALLNAYDAAPSRPRRVRAIACSVLFLWFALHAARVTGSLATSAHVSPRQDGSNQEVHGMQHKKRFVATAGAVALSLAGASAAQDAVEWRVVEGGNGHWYRADPTSRDWTVAKTYAASIGGYLATVHSAGENDLILSIALPNYGDYWLGGFRTAFGCEVGCFAWVTSEPWTYTGTWNWSDSAPCSEPNPNTCGWNGPDTGSVLEISARPDFGAGSWNDESPTLYYAGNIIGAGAIIEWSADCNNDGIVDFGQILAGELDDANHNNIPDCCEASGSCNCPGDVARDGVVNGIDLAAVLNNWGTSGGAINADANGDGIVDAEDLALVLGSWGECP